MLDYSSFVIDDFDINDYANTILAGELYPQHQTQFTKPGMGAASKDDISVTISKLDSSIENVGKQIKSLVCNYIVTLRCF
ncbi:uncharacterized protein F5891DRAFT_958196 [Suillus fuscotomentosus]|uniref:Uncharacterized protein n=1 Tax=Suillus fuscotomentosus TaxID=1912939 RepID=A0AAD4E058_9AGAM|nr:uncharacterized protein F5891DRAFT_958196 [Suillus fuscotomentosus]KAG1896776.1 hypothetical protein F5891DRAFT_958196 [Suillus fuscotomentosus]